MSEALEKVLDYLHNDQKIKRIECGCCIENIPSKKVIEKNNMIYEGIKKNEVLLKDGYHDMYLYVLENKQENNMEKRYYNYYLHTLNQFTKKYELKNYGVFEIVLQWENDLVIAGCYMLFSPNNHNKK